MMKKREPLWKIIKSHKQPNNFKQLLTKAKFEEQEQNN